MRFCASPLKSMASIICIPPGRGRDVLQAKVAGCAGLMPPGQVACIPSLVSYCTLYCINNRGSFFFHWFEWSKTCVVIYHCMIYRDMPINNIYFYGLRYDSKLLSLVPVWALPFLRVWLTKCKSAVVCMWLVIYRWSAFINIHMQAWRKTVPENIRKFSKHF